MTTAPSLPDADLAAQLAAEQARRLQAETALAAASAHIAHLEDQLADVTSSAQRHYNQLVEVMHNMRVGLLLIDHEGHIRFINQHFRELFGLSAEATTAIDNAPIPVAAVYIGDAFADPAAFTARAHELYQAGQTVLQEEFILADGRVVELDYLVLDYMQAGRLVCYRDVTERHQREAQLRLLAYIPQQNPNPIVRLSATGELIYANPAATPLLDALGADSRTDLQNHLQSLVRAALRTPVQHQQTLAVAEHYYIFTVVAVPGQPYATLYLTNITARRQAEQHLAEQRAFYETILNQVPMAVAVFDAEHRYRFVNPSVEPDPIMRAWMIGKTNDEACKHRKRPRSSARQRNAAFARAVHEQREIAWEEKRNSSTEHKHYLRLLRPIMNPDGTLQLMISSGVDITERKKLEEKATRQQEFYESILDLLPVDVAVFDAEHRYLFVNPSGITNPLVRKQVIGMTNAEYFASRPHLPGELVRQREQYFELAVRTRTDVTWEEMLPGQRPKLILRYLRPVFNPDGSLRMVVGSGIDITARYVAEQLQHQVQKQLLEQQAFIRQIVDALPNVLYLVEPNGQVSFTNTSYDTMIARSQHWLPEGQTNTAVREEMRRIQALNQQVLTTQQPVSQELPFTLSSGETLFYQVYKRPMHRADGQLSILTISTEVTDVKQARQALERREKQYHDLVYYSQALICTHDAEGRLLSVNPAIERLMQLPATRLVGRHLRDAVPAEHHPALQAYLDGTIAEQPQPRIVAVRTSSGKLRYLHYYTYRVTEEGYPSYTVASGYDVTEGVQAQRALKQAKLEAEENAQAKESFLARMSHEIRTPLNGVLGMAGLLEKTVLTPAQREYLHTMQHAGEHLLALVNDVLDMAKITTQHLELHHAPFDLAVALQGAGQTVAALAEQQGLQLTVKPLTIDSPRVLGDAYRLHQVLLNLLSNAIKFTQQGQVRLGTDVLADTPEALTLSFWVEDTGIGISPEEQVHIFDAFTQASAETSRRFGGTGLGLAISQQLVRQMGGELRLRSSPGEGTVFSFELTLPRTQVAAAEHQPALPITSSESLRGLRVLLAEDNLVNQWIAVVVLEQWGMQVLAVGNGTDALHELSTNTFDVAILDIQMPGLSGVEVTTAIRQHPNAARAGIPIIALTANAFAADRITYLEAGMNACLTKPYEEADLSQLLLQLTQEQPRQSDFRS